jgi:hypothetical protein
MYLGNTTIAGACQVTGFVAHSLDPVVTAAGTNQATAYPVTKQNTVVISAAAGTGLVLPAGAGGTEGWIVNAGANAITVYPNGTNTLNGQAAGVGVLVPAPGSLHWLYITSTAGFAR